MKRRGFSLVEVLCVIALTGVLLAAIGFFLMLHAQLLERSTRVSSSGATALVLAEQIGRDLQALAVDVGRHQVHPEERNAGPLVGNSMTLLLERAPDCSSAESEAQSGRLCVAYRWHSLAGSHVVTSPQDQQQMAYEVRDPGLARVLLLRKSPRQLGGTKVDWALPEVKTIRFRYRSPMRWEDEWTGSDGTWPIAVAVEWIIEDDSGQESRGQFVVPLTPNQSYGDSARATR